MVSAKLERTSQWKLEFLTTSIERGGATAASGHSVSGSHGLLNDAGGPIELIPVDKLTPYPGNARKHSRKQIREVANSIERFGFTNPVLIDDDAQIIAGHGRVEAAKLLGMKSVPTLSRRQARVHHCRQPAGRKGRLGPRAFGH